MAALQLLLNRWKLALILASTFLTGAMAGLMLLAISREKALKLGERLDALRKPAAEILFEILKKPRGALKAVLFIFGVNLIGGAGLYATVGGILIIPAVFWLAFLGSW